METKGGQKGTNWVRQEASVNDYETSFSCLRSFVGKF